MATAILRPRAFEVVADAFAARTEEPRALLPRILPATDAPSCAFREVGSMEEVSVAWSWQWSI